MRAILLAALAGISGPTQAVAQTVPPPDSAALPGPGISRALAVHRARTIAEVRYDLALDLTALDSAPGRVTIAFRRTGAGDVVLDFRGRRLTAAAANGAAFEADPHNGHLRVPARLLRPGRNRLDLAFVADVAPAGASIIRSHDADGSDYLYTLLVPADASQLFPCFDQPDLKARVRLTLQASREWSVVANGPVESVDTAGGRSTTRFAETRPISTYLIGFAAGPWHRATSTDRGRTITAYVRRSRAAEADLDTLLALNHRALRWMEGYFGRRYPFEKFDFVLAPAFPFGGMEHPGAVFYSEDAFIFRERPTLPRRLGRYSTILHEAAHQWFGDLVTMRWFDDLWLKEGFATFMASKALADLEPAADAWKTFHLGNKPGAYAVDRTPATRPLWQALDNLEQAKSNYGPIVYNKAPSVLKQLEYLVGEPAFRLGVRSFLQRHSYGNADWRDLLRSVGEAAGRPLDRFGREWMLRAGMPVVEQRLELSDGRIARLSLVQEPAQDFCDGAATPADRSPGDGFESGGAVPPSEASGTGPRPCPGTGATWTQRTELLLAYSGRPPVRLPVELRDGETDVPAARGRPAPAYVFANAGDYGYFLLLLDSASTRTLEAGALGRTEDPFLRTMLWGALWDQVQALRLPPEHFVRLALQELPAETDEQIVPFVLARLDRSVRAYLAPARREKSRAELERVLLGGAADRGRSYGVRKAFADAFIRLAASPDGVSRLDALLDADSVAGEPLQDPTRWAIVSRLLRLGAPSAAARLAAQERRDTTPDGRRRAFIAGAGRPDATTKRRYWDRWFADSTLNEEWASGSLPAFNALEHEALTLPFLAAALDSLPFIQRNRRIFFLEDWLAAFLGGQTSRRALEVVEDYLAGRPPPAPAPDLRLKVLQHADELERTVRIRGAAGAPDGSPPDPGPDSGPLQSGR